MIKSNKLDLFRGLIFIIFIFLCIMSVGLVLITFQSLFNLGEISNINIYDMLYGDTICILFSITIYRVYSIIKSLKSNPFTEKNIKNFKIIYRCMMLVTFLDGIFTYNIPKDTGFILMGNESASLKPSCILYFILAVVALTLSYIFEKAVEIKNENDLTV